MREPVHKPLVVSGTSPGASPGASPGVRQALHSDQTGVPGENPPRGPQLPGALTKWLLYFTRGHDRGDKWSLVVLPELCPAQGEGVPLKGEVWWTVTHGGRARLGALGPDPALSGPRAAASESPWPRGLALPLSGGDRKHAGLVLFFGGAG